MTVPNIADISVLETLQNSANAQMGISGTAVFNAKFTETRKLTPEQEKEAEKCKDAILDAEKKFRQNDDKEWADIQAEKKRLDMLMAKRIAEANAFEKNKGKLESPLGRMGINVVWEEPKVDKTRIDVRI